MHFKKITFSVRGHLKTIELPCVAGILNLTSDSFYSGSRITDENHMLKKADKMIEEGAGILDLGAVSTRPGAKLTNQKEELSRLIPSLNLLRKEFPEILVSIDTFRSEVARIAESEGADIINDISGGTMDNNMFAVVAELRLPYIMMHIKGTPENMQNNPQYDNLLNDINDFFANRIKDAEHAGIHDIIIDPGFGFGKTIAHNFELLAKLALLAVHKKTVLAGISRKSMIYKTLGTTPENALTGTIALNTVALMNGANILRVHDVKEAVDTIQLVQNTLRNGENELT